LIHYDPYLNATTYFRPSLKKLVNTLLDRDFEQMSAVKFLYSVELNSKLGSWSYSFNVLALSYLIMIGVGLLGLVVPTTLFVILAPILVFAMNRALLLSVLAHGVILGLVVSLVIVNPIFVVVAFGLFLVGRILIDVPYLKMVKSIGIMYDELGFVYGHGYSMPIEKTEQLFDTIKALRGYGTSDILIAEAYILGHYLSEDEKYNHKEVGDFVEHLLKECVV